MISILYQQQLKVATMIPKYYPPINPLLVSADSLNKYNNNNDKKIIIKTTTALAKIISN